MLLPMMRASICEMGSLFLRTSSTSSAERYLGDKEGLRVNTEILDTTFRKSALCGINKIRFFFHHDCDLIPAQLNIKNEIHSQDVTHLECSINLRFLFFTRVLELIEIQTHFMRCVYSHHNCTVLPPLKMYVSNIKTYLCSLSPS